MENLREPRFNMEIIRDPRVNMGILREQDSIWEF